MSSSAGRQSKIPKTGPRAKKSFQFRGHVSLNVNKERAGDVTPPSISIDSLRLLHRLSERDASVVGSSLQGFLWRCCTGQRLSESD